MWQVMNTKDKRDPLLPWGLGSVVFCGEHRMLTWSGNWSYSLPLTKGLASPSCVVPHSPCLAWEMAFIHLILSSAFTPPWLPASSFERGLPCAIMEELNQAQIPRFHAVPVPQYPQFEGQPLPTDFFADIFLLVFNTGAASLTHLSRDSTKVISSLTLAHLNSLVKAETGSCNSPLL